MYAHTYVCMYVYGYVCILIIIKIINFGKNQLYVIPKIMAAQKIIAAYYHIK